MSATWRTHTYTCKLCGHSSDRHSGLGGGDWTPQVLACEECPDGRCELPKTGP